MQRVRQMNIIIAVVVALALAGAFVAAYVRASSGRHEEHHHESRLPGVLTAHEVKVQYVGFGFLPPRPDRCPARDLLRKRPGC